MFKALNELYDTEEVTTPLRYYDYTCSLESIAEQHIPVQGVQMESNDDSKSTDAVSSAASIYYLLLQRGTEASQITFRPFDTFKVSTGML